MGFIGGSKVTIVALRKESVDRNIPRGQLPTPEPPVALRKESVDRNLRSQKI